MPTLSHVTSRLAAGAAVADVAPAETGWSGRTLQRQCGAVYGYGPATLRRILRFRQAIRMVRDGLGRSPPSPPPRGYSHERHLHREVRELAGVPLRTLLGDHVWSVANRSTQLPSGSDTVA